MQLKFKIFKKLFSSLPEYSEIEKAMNDKNLPIAISGLSHIHRILLCVCLAADNGLKPLIITSGEAENERV